MPPFASSVMPQLAAAYSLANQQTAVQNAMPPPPPALRQLPSVQSDPKIKIALENQELWDEFHKLNTEMIITKLGR